MTDTSDVFTRALLSIKGEIAVAQNCLGEAAIAAAHERLGEAKELLTHAKRSYRNIIEQISKLPSKYDARSHAAIARILEGQIDELEQQILKNDAT